MRIHFYGFSLNLVPGKAIDQQLIVPVNQQFTPGDDLSRFVYENAKEGWVIAMEALCSKEPGSTCITDGYGITKGSLVFASIPNAHQCELKDLVLCFQNCLDSANRHREGTSAVSITFSSFSFDSFGWSESDAIHALWQAIMNIREDDPYISNPSLDINVYYSRKGECASNQYRYRISQAFFTGPSQWGLRGDPYLWNHLMHHFDDPEFDHIDLRTFINETRREIEAICNEPLSPTMTAMVESLAHGGMSSGVVSGEFWTSKGIPLLCENLCKLGLDGEQGAKLFVDVEIFTFMESHHYKLPYRILDDLQALQSHEYVKPLSMLDLFKTNQKSNVPHTEGTNEMNLNDIPLEGIVDYQAPQQELVKQSKSISEQMSKLIRESEAYYKILTPKALEEQLSADFEQLGVNIPPSSINDSLFRLKLLSGDNIDYPANGSVIFHKIRVGLGTKVIFNPIHREKLVELLERIVYDAMSND